MRKFALVALMLGGFLVPSVSPVEAQFSPCQLCWTSSGDTGQCLNVVTPSPSLSTLSDCQGTTKCFPQLGGEPFCIAACTGSQCYWV